MSTKPNTVIPNNSTQSSSSSASTTQILLEQSAEQKKQSILLTQLLTELKRSSDSPNSLNNEVQSLNDKLQQQALVFIIGGLAVIGVFAWKEVLESVIHTYMPIKAESELAGKLIAAIFVTFIIVIFTYISSTKFGYKTSGIDSKII